MLLMEPHMALFVAPAGVAKTLSLGFTRAGVLQPFRFHHYHLYHPAIQ